MAQDEKQAGKPSPGWIDAHCHLADPRLAPSLEAVAARARAAGVTGWIQGGVGPDDWDRQLEVRRTLGPGCVPVFGLHPWWVAAADDEALDRALGALKTRLPEAKGVGELGLDLLPRHAASLGRQTRAFRAQLGLAKEAGLPLVLHVVRAHPEALAELEAQGPFPKGGLVHSFSAGPAEAARYLALGLTLSVGGSVTRDNSGRLKKTVASVAPDRLVVETDAPDQTPSLPGLERHALNEPAVLPRLADVIAAHRGVTRDALLTQSADNLKRLFSL